MIAGFIVVLFIGHYGLVLGIFALQVFVVKELMDLRDKTIFRKLIQDRRREKLPLFLDWFWFAATTYFIYGRIFIRQFPDVFYSHGVLSTLAKNHTMISFGFYCFTFLAFVLTLEPGLYKVQFKQLGWTFLVLIFTVLQSSFYLATVFEGMVWLFLPASMVIANDIWAYIVGFLVGKRPLIQLSPKKTWEGFLGGMIATLFFGMLFASFLAQYQWMVCPKEDLFSWGVSCTPGYVFQWREYQLPQVVTELLKLIGIHRSTVSLLPVQLHSLAFALFASFIAPFGGFFASGFKRGVNIKDFGQSIPGHGGITDRMDCQSLMGVFAYLYYSTYIKTADVHKLLGLIYQLSAVDQLQLFTHFRDYLANKGVTV